MKVMIAKKSSNGKEGGMFRVHRVLAFSERARAKSTQRKLGLKGHITLRNFSFQCGTYSPQFIRININ